MRRVAGRVGAGSGVVVAMVDGRVVMVMDVRFDGGSTMGEGMRERREDDGRAYGHCE